MNPMCDGGRCHIDTGEVRVLPLGKSPHHGNLILCKPCFEHELNFRRERNRDLGKDAQFALPAWDSLEVYGQ
jgi:hypothetical protein